MLKDISSRLRSGALVILIEEADELLALESAKHAAKQVQPIKKVSASDPEALSLLSAHATAQGTLILCDFLRVHAANPVAIRLIREVALQRRKDDEQYSRLVLLETPGVQIPDSLLSDIEYIPFKIPTVKELIQELDEFVTQHDLKLPGNGEVQHEIAAAVAGLPRHEAARLFARCLIERRNTLDTVWLRKQKAERVADRLGGALTFVDVDSPSIGGLDGLKNWLKARKNAFGSEKARKFGLPEPKGVLLFGIPGTGKSLTAKTVAKEWGLPLLRLDPGKLYGSLVGQSESQTRQAIQAAEACSPCILWIDEIEKGLSGGDGDSGTSSRVLGTILTWLQDKTKPVFIVATANDITKVPPELMRKGRIDEIFFLNLPTLKERKEIVKIHIERHGRKLKNFDWVKIAQNTEGFSGSEIEQAVIEGLFAAFSADRELKTNDVLDAIKATTPLSKTMSKQIEKIKDWAKGRARTAATDEEIVGTTKRAGRGAMLK